MPKTKIVVILLVCLSSLVPAQDKSQNSHETEPILESNIEAVGFILDYWDYEIESMIDARNIFAPEENITLNFTADKEPKDLTKGKVEIVWNSNIDSTITGRYFILGENEYWLSLSLDGESQRSYRIILMMMEEEGFRITLVREFDKVNVEISEELEQEMIEIYILRNLLN